MARREDLVEFIKPLLRMHDLVIALGAGSIHATAEELVRSLTGAETSSWTMQ